MSGMYINIIYRGKTLLEWQKLTKNEYSLGELYRMSKDNIDFEKLICEKSILSSLPV